MALLTVRQGAKYGPEYVHLIRNQHPCITLTDRMDTPGEKVALLSNLTGWWAKMELFAPWNRSLRPCLFVDLDTYIMDDISDLLEPVNELHLIPDFYQPHRSNSGVMRIPEHTEDIWQAFLRYRGPMKGDGDFLTTLKHKRIEGMMSYKIHCQKEPKGKIICFHGFPKPHETTGWARERWNTYSTP